jgi:hypothetical protein
MKKCPPLIAVVIAGCGQQGAIEETIKAHLKDPESAQFRTVLVSKKGDRGCAIWNAKNSFGGYGEWAVTELEKHGGRWQITAANGRADRCTESAYKTWDEYEEASERLRKRYEGKTKDAPPVISEEDQRRDKELQDLVKEIDSRK